MATPIVEEAALTKALDRLYDELLQAYIAENKASQELHNEASHHLPNGNTRSVLFYEPFPIALASGRGCHVTSVDGKEYIDFVSEYSAALLGHSHPDIHKAITTALDQGINLGGPSRNEVVLAKQIKDRFKSIEQVRFTNSGSEANMMALGVATLYTGRKKILVFENSYHGSFASFGSGNPSPFNSPHDFVIARYNDITHVQSLMSTSIAAILVEPMQGAGSMIPASSSFLQHLRNTATTHNALLIFDEIITSQLHMHGLQGKYNIYPDMTTLGKYLGGGASFGAFGGSKRLMSVFGKAPHSGTYNNNVISMAAGVAAGSLLTREKLDRANALGDRLRDGVNTLASRSDPQLVTATGLGSCVGLHFAGPTPDRLRDCLFLFLLGRGVYVGKRGFVSVNLVHEEGHVDALLQAVGEILEIVHEGYT